MPSFGEQLRTYRERLGMSQQTLAERADVSPSQLSRMQSGQKGPPPAETVLRMVDVLRLNSDEAVDLLEVAGYSPQLLGSSTVVGGASGQSIQDLIESLEHAAADLESASKQLRNAIRTLTSISSPTSEKRT